MADPIQLPLFDFDESEEETKPRDDIPANPEPTETSTDRYEGPWTHAAATAGKYD